MSDSRAVASCSLCTVSASGAHIPTAHRFTAGARIARSGICSMPCPTPFCALVIRTSIRVVGFARLPDLQRVRLGALLVALALISGCGVREPIEEVSINGRFSNAGDRVWMGIATGGTDAWSQSEPAPSCASNLPECAFSVPAGVPRITLVGRSTGRAPIRREVDIELARKRGQREISLDLTLSNGESVVGVVFGEEGALAGVRIHGELIDEPADSTPEEAQQRATTSDRDGRFVLAGLETGTYRIRFEADGHMPARREWRVPTDGRELQIVLGRSGFVEGLVLNDVGEPVSDSRVFGGKLYAVTDGSGKFVLGPFDWSAEVTVEAFAHGSRSDRTATEVPASGVTLRIARLGGFRGLVLDSETGEPVEDFCVYVDPRDTKPRALTFHNLDGVFRLGVVAGRYRIGVAAREYVPFILDRVIVEEQSQSEVRFDMERGGQIEGWVVDSATDGPIPGAWVRHGGFEWAASQCGVQQAQSSEDGSFVLGGAPDGRVTVDVGAVRYLSKRIEVSAHDRIVVRMSKGGSVFGTLAVPDGLSGAGASIRLVGNDTLVTTTDADGRFEFHGLHDGRYQVEASIPSWPAVKRELSIVNAETVRNFEMVIQSIDGTGSVAGTVSGLPDCEVARVEIDGSVADIGVRGRYELHGILAGERSVVVRSADCGLAQRALTKARTVMVREGETTTLDISLAGNARLFGRVTRGDEGTVTRLVASPLSPDSNGVVGTVFTSEHGHYEIPGLTDGRYSVDIHGRLFTVDVHGDTRFDTDLCQVEGSRSLPCNSLTLSGRVDAPNGHGLFGAHVSLAGQHRKTRVSTDSNGAFVFRELPPDEYTIGVHKRGYDLAFRQVRMHESLEGVLVTLSATSQGEPGGKVVVQDLDTGYRITGIVVDVATPENPKSSFYLPLDSDGGAMLPPSLAGRDLTFLYYGYEPVTVPNWDGDPLMLNLTRCADGGVECTLRSRATTDLVD